MVKRDLTPMANQSHALFKRKASLVVGGITDGIDLSRLQFKFSVKMADVTHPQYATFRITAQGGQLTGDAYKQAASDIGKAAQKLSGSEPLVADALRDYGSIFDAAARRNSNPATVEMLDKTDAGYAKAVRIEMAAQTRGGGTGRFSPTQFDSAVQKASGGVRSRAYLRGDALMGDYAAAGKSLMDKLPNSGTADRLMTKELLTGQGFVAPALGGLAYLHPGAAALTGALTLPYAPGVQRMARAALAPSTSQRARTLGDLLRQRGGALGAPAALQGGQALGLLPPSRP